MVAVQNLLMQKLSLSNKNQFPNKSFDKLVKMFDDGLSEEQVEKITKIFMVHVPPADPAEVDEEA
jgi:hypothetical protein